MESSKDTEKVLLPVPPSSAPAAAARLRAATAAARSAWFSPRWTLHSPPILAGFTILTAFLVWMVLTKLPIAQHSPVFPLPGAENSSKLKEEREREREEQTPREPPRLLAEAADAKADLAPFVAPPTLAPPAQAPADVQEPRPERSSALEPGEAAMNRQLKNSLQVAFLGWCFGLPACAVLADDKAAPGETADRLNKIERNIDDLKTKLNTLDESVKAFKDNDYLKPIREDVAQLKTDLTRLKDEAPKKVEARKQPITDEPKAADAVRDLNERVKHLEQVMENLPLTIQAHSRDLTRVIQDVQQVQRDLTTLKQELESARARISRYPADNAASGKIQLVNAWMSPMSVVIDGLAYRLAPGETRTVSKPAGTFTYEVIGVQSAPVARSVTAGETFTIRIAPQ